MSVSAEESAPPPAAPAAPVTAESGAPKASKEFFVGGGVLTSYIDGNIKGDWEHQWKSSPQGRLGLLIGISTIGNSSIDIKVGPAVQYAKSVEELKSGNGKAKIESTHSALQAAVAMNLHFSSMPGFRLSGQLFIDVVSNFESKLQADGFSSTLKKDDSRYAISAAGSVSYEIVGNWWPFLSIESQPISRSGNYANAKFINAASVGASYAF